ncbi:MAG: hypothetical protein ACUBOA_14485 [Candidatus Loosdrechtia sp.]|uniref:hypothetical protein n=1 Tax=Candidatus Loosdrechtia sp. TaxID=3101272 RepID=UPI003A61E898|nr:MAG: hypothetical protein QY305_04280 [Candidatus Jettenia sp. AMX2]
MENVWAIVTKPDNIPIVALLFMLFFFTGISFKQAFHNDRLIEEKKQDKKG